VSLANCRASLEECTAAANQADWDQLLLPLVSVAADDTPVHTVRMESQTTSNDSQLTPSFAQGFFCDGATIARDWAEGYLIFSYNIIVAIFTIIPVVFFFSILFRSLGLMLLTLALTVVVPIAATAVAAIEVLLIPVPLVVLVLGGLLAFFCGDGLPFDSILNALGGEYKELDDLDESTKTSLKETLEEFADTGTVTFEDVPVSEEELKKLSSGMSTNIQRAFQDGSITTYTVNDEDMPPELIKCRVELFACQLSQQLEGSLAEWAPSP